MRIGLRKFGFLLSVMAILWLVIPCEAHCYMITPIEKSTGCCPQDTKDSNSSTPTKSNSDSLKQLCKSIISSVITPANVQYVPYQVCAIHSDLILTATLTQNGLGQTQYAWNLHSPPLEIQKQLLISSLYTPHAPPALV